jgi:phosphomannomutase
MSELVGERIARFPVSGELNYRVPDSAAALSAIESKYAPLARASERVDGLSYEFADWRFNLRSSNTEPLIRLNVEARGSQDLMRSKTLEVLEVLKSHGAVAADH